MIRPARLLIWIAGLLGAPLGLAAAVWENAVWLFLPALAFVGTAAAVDLRFGRKKLEDLSARGSGETNLVQARETSVTVHLRKPANLSGAGTAGLAFPPPFACAKEELAVALMDGVSEQSITWTTTPRERGRFLLDALYIGVRSPLGLWECGRAVPLGLELSVFPDAGRYGKLLARLRGQMGVRWVRQLGKGREFEKLREYASGDGFEDIHWKATARRGAPITKTYQTERMQEIYVLVDTSRLMARRFGDHAAIDEYLRVALLVGNAAEQRGDRFGLVLFDREVRRFVRARNGKAHYAACRKAIFDAQTAPVPADFFELASFLRARVPKRSLLLLLTALDEPSAAASAERAAALLGERHLPYVVMLQPGGVHPLLSGPAGESVDAALAGHLQWRALRQLELSLRRHGVRFQMAEPSALAATVLALYDEVKQRQLL